ncbi:hypothetical protein [Prescottella subtropica]|uniref:hypothetical protein n=1 Tax=Prescottella subtropica TaxID=2545757 RepID=UPI0010F570DF|nr:hypothetical protein [Prescottella subtropica]
MSKNHRWWALAAAPAVGLIFFSAQQTGALWSDTETLPGATITAGTLNIGVGAGSFTLDSFGKTGLAAGGYSQTPLTVKNTGDVPTQYRLSNVTQSDAALPLTLKVWEVANEASCPATGDPTGTPTQIYDGNMIGASTALRPALQSGAETVLCLRGTVATGAGAGLTSTTTFTFDASQV